MQWSTGKDEAMSKGNDIANDRDPKFSFATRELREAQHAEARAARQSSQPAKKSDAGGGFDPYNTSGGFDRRKNWERVGKR
jgi:hypothetical protein